MNAIAADLARALDPWPSAAFPGSLALAAATDSLDYLPARRRYPPWPRRGIRSGRPAHPRGFIPVP